jgi:hypothetical protein
MGIIKMPMPTQSPERQIMVDAGQGDQQSAAKAGIK